MTKIAKTTKSAKTAKTTPDMTINFSEIARTHGEDIADLARTHGVAVAESAAMQGTKVPWTEETLAAIEAAWHKRLPSMSMEYVLAETARLERKYS